MYPNVTIFDEHIYIISMPSHTNKIPKGGWFYGRGYVARNEGDSSVEQGGAYHPQHYSKIEGSTNEMINLAKVDVILKDEHFFIISNRKVSKGDYVYDPIKNIFKKVKKDSNFWKLEATTDPSFAPQNERMVSTVQVLTGRDLSRFREIKKYQRMSKISKLKVL